jgi:hypothetical protein
MDSRAESAKPPSPVQIRAAPPNSQLTLSLAGVAFSSPAANFSPEQSISLNNRSSTSSTALRCRALHEFAPLLFQNVK